MRTAERLAISLVCPECNHEMSELVAHLQQQYRYGCRNCTFVFDLSQGTDYRTLIEKLVRDADEFDVVLTQRGDAA